MNLQKKYNSYAIWAFVFLILPLFLPALIIKFFPSINSNSPILYLIIFIVPVFGLLHVFLLYKRKKNIYNDATMLFDQKITTFKNKNFFSNENKEKEKQLLKNELVSIKML